MIDDTRDRIGKQVLAALIALPVVYFLSMGPVFRFIPVNQMAAFNAFYGPIFWWLFGTPMEGAVLSYLRLWGQ